MGDSPRLLFHSNAPWVPTGYGQQTAQFAPGLAEHYDLAISAYYGLEAAPLTWKRIPVLPGLGPEYGNEFLIPHANFHFEGDPRDGLVLILMDVWVLSPEIVGQLNAACWVPVDHEPVQDGVKNFFRDSGAVPLAMSKFGAEQLAEFDPIYVPHGIDVDTYTAQPKAEAREALKLPEDAFVVGIVAANKGRPSRKCFQHSLEAFAELQREHDDAYLYLHTALKPEWSGGEDLPALLAALDVPEDRVKVASQYRTMFMPWSHEQMALIYSAFDVLLNPSAGEGFGIPVLEAQACGVPAIVTDFSAMSEVCGVGWKVGFNRFWTPQNSWQVHPKVPELVEALQESYAMGDTERRKLSKQARQHSLKYAGPKVLDEYLLPALEEITGRIGERPELAAA